MAEIEEAEKLDPSSTPILADKGFVLAMEGDFNHGEMLLRQIEAAEPDFLSAHTYLRDLYCDGRNYQLCLQESQSAAGLQHDAGAEEALVSEEKTAGFTEFYEARLEADKARFQKGSVGNFVLAADYAALDHRAEALQYLQAAYQNHEWLMCSLLVNPLLKNFVMNRNSATCCEGWAAAPELAPDWCSRYFSSRRRAALLRPGRALICILCSMLKG